MKSFSRFLLLMAIPLLLSGCPTFPDYREPESKKTSQPEKSGKPAADKNYPGPISFIARRHAAVDTPGGRVLKAAVEMIENGNIVTGSCWDYVHAVYQKAGYALGERYNVYMAGLNGPYAGPSLLIPGDWVYYRNLPYGEIEHSAIFVEWIDFSRRSALTIEYVGRNSKSPGRFREADLTRIFGILRGEE